MSTANLVLNTNDTVITDNKNLAERITAQKTKWKKLIYANKAALEDTILKEKPTKIWFNLNLWNSSLAAWEGMF